MFNFVIILNTEPFYIFARSEQEVQEIICTYKNKVEKIIKGTDLKAQSFQTHFSFIPEKTILIPEIVDEKEKNLVPQEIKDQLTDELAIDSE